MDAASISAIVTGSVAIVAALTGAGVTGFVNYRNTQATLAAARQTSEDQWSRTRDREHEVWLRDQRQEVYVAFHDEADKLTAKLVEWSPEEGAPLDLLQKLKSLRSRIKIVGSPTIRVQARDVEGLLFRGLLLKQAMYALTHDARTGELDTVQYTEITGQMSDVRTRMLGVLIDFVLAVREDLGTATEQDRQLNAHLQTEAIADGPTNPQYIAPAG